MSCTDVLAQWPVPKTRAPLKMDKIKNLEWTQRRQATGAPSEPLSAWTFQIEEILQEVRNANNTSAIMTLRKPFSEHFRQDKKTVEAAIQQQTDTGSRDILQLYFSNLYNEQCKHKSLEELRAIGELLEIRYTKNDVELIESITQQQCNSKQWYRLRAGRITASIFYKVCRTSLLKGSQSLIETICWPEKHIFSSMATNHGKKYEPIAREDYIDSLKQNHKNFSVIQCGLIVNEKYPYFGASPDGIINCDCCEKGTLEIKCPFKQIRKNEKGIFVASEKMPALCVNQNDEYIMNEEHYFYYQVQMQIILCEAKYSDFVIWVHKKNIVRVRVLRDDHFWQQNFPKAERFFKMFVAPEMLANHFTNAKKQKLDLIKVKY